MSSIAMFTEHSRETMACMEDMRKLCDELQHLITASTDRMIFYRTLFARFQTKLHPEISRCDANEDSEIQPRLMKDILDACQKQRAADSAAVPGWSHIRRELTNTRATNATTSDVEGAPPGSAGSDNKAADRESGHENAGALDSVAVSDDNVQHAGVNDDVEASADRVGEQPAADNDSPSEIEKLEEEKTRLQETFQQLCEKREQLKDLYLYMLPPDGETYEVADERLEDMQRDTRRKLNVVKDLIRAHKVARYAEDMRHAETSNVWEENINSRVQNLRYTPREASEDAESTRSSAPTLVDDERMAHWVQTVESVMQQFAPPLVAPTPCDHFYWTSQLGGPDPPRFELPQRSRTFPISLCAPCFTRVSAIRRDPARVPKLVPSFVLVSKPAQQTV